MRLTTAMWFAVFRRLEEQRGAYLTVVRTGAQQAGVVFIVQKTAGYQFNIYGPAPQVFAVEGISERLFEQVASDVPQEEVDRFIEKQLQFDPDLWVIETEAGSGEISLQLLEART
ncbi:MAG: DUF1491 family protein [Pseudomonadota bacterium]